MCRLSTLLWCRLISSDGRGLRGDVVVLSIMAAGPGLQLLPVKPEMTGTAKFGLVTLAKRHQAPALPIVHAQLPGWIAEIQSV